MLVLAVFAALAGEARAGTTTFASTGCSLWTVPSGLQGSVSITATGAAGGNVSASVTHD